MHYIPWIPVLCWCGWWSLFLFALAMCHSFEENGKCQVCEEVVWNGGFFVDWSKISSERVCVFIVLLWTNVKVSKKQVQLYLSLGTRVTFVSAISSALHKGHVFLHKTHVLRQSTWTSSYRQTLDRNYVCMYSMQHEVKSYSKLTLMATIQVTNSFPMFNFHHAYRAICLMFWTITNTAQILMIS